MISPETISTVRDRVRLSEVVGKRVRLERRGRSLLGLCPFHKEKSPSFHVHDDRGFFHCFGCQASGDVFKFLMETEGLSFTEAVTQLAERVGVLIDLDLSDDEQKQRKARKRREEELYQINETAAAYFERMLREHPEAPFAHEELAARDLPYDGPASHVLHAFRVGYAPPGWDGLTSEIRRLGLSVAAAEAVGLIAGRQKGSGHYDRFRHRLMFAVVDLQGRVVAFSGRALKPTPKFAVEAGAESAPPKYVNSPETPIYRKRDNVFGLYQSRSSLRDNQPCVVVEGNFDVVSLHARGVPRAVAPLGTAFTLEQARLIRRFTTEAIFLFDADEAGQNAVKKAREPCLAADLRAKVGTLPSGKDPDEFSRAQGSDALLLVLSRASGMVDHLVRCALDHFVPSGDSAGLARKVQEIGELIAIETDPTVRAFAIQNAAELASRLGILDRQRFENLLRAGSRGGREAEPKIGREVLPSQKTSSPAKPQNRRPPHERLEEQVLGVLLDFPELLDSPELQGFGLALQGDLALCVAVLHRTPDKVGQKTNFHETLAKIPEPLRPFVSARLAAPVHEDLAIARAELLANLKKLLALEHARMARAATRELEQARLEGDLSQELQLLGDLTHRARLRQGI